MRNLKRALSLGLTAAMISGLMVMGSSAVGYADVTSEQNQEAIEVLQAVGVMVGDEDGFSKLGVDSVDETVAFYLDTQGNIIMVDEADEASDYAYVLSVGSQDDLYGGSGTYGARLILADGTVMRVSIDDDTTDSYSTLSAVQAAFEGRLVSYSEEDDGSYSLSVVGELPDQYDTLSGDDLTDVVRNGSSRVRMPDGSYIYADSNTVFLIHDMDEEDDDEFSAYVGYDNVPDVDVTAATDVVYYVNSRGVARMVILVNADEQGSANDVIFVVGNKSAGVNGSSSNRYYVYDAVINGEVVEMEVRAGSDA